MNKYEIDEILNLAIMSKTPYIIVEGVDDIHIYEAIAKSANTICEIYAVDMIEGLAGGNDGVIEAMQIVEALNLPAGKLVEQFMMGIIDRDARFYRNEIPNSPSIFSLSYYSIESHFVSKFTIKPTIDQLTRISVLDEIDIDSIYIEIGRRLFDAYYFSLDALKNAVDPTYQSIIGYSSNIGRRKDANTVSKLQARKHDLDIFAVVHNISSSVESMRKFVKGKWLLTAFVEEMFVEIEGLVKKCKGSAIKQCRMCELDNAAPCLYQLRGGVTKNSTYSTIQDFVHIPDFDYLREALKAVEATAKA
ncbi:MAG: DUF4435 domain-containing protein [Rhodocyclales bacterium GT-UBC]|nr:MAG: DUF4435 domain-containing protein [Rhodocyclales bacterium GT-UBC]